uniref:Putative vesicle coat complex copii subunit sfb3 n=1 Tax=Ixodes ricinus TaxID=34613 RepID=A0A6B0VEA8_IXORI
MSKTLLGLKKDPRGLCPLNKEDELLTAEVEEDDYDALNDETFGAGLEEDWEEAHEKFAELEDKGKTVPHGPLVPKTLHEEDDPYILHEEVVERSISHLGLEDDHDYDPAIRAYSKAVSSPRPMEWSRPVSPPPPAILQQEFGGSPKTETIWTPKPVHPPPPEDRLTSLLWKLRQQSSPTQVAPGQSSLPATARTLEDLERDMLRPAGSNPVPIGSPQRVHRGWSPGMRAEQLERELLGHPQQPFPSGAPPCTSPRGRSFSDLEPEAAAARRRQPPPLPEGSTHFRGTAFSPDAFGSPPSASQGYPGGRGHPLARSRPCMSPPVAPAAGALPPPHGRLSPGLLPPNFAGSRMPLSVPPPVHPMMGRGRMMGHFPPVILNNAMHGRMPLPGGPPGFRPGMNQVRFPPPNHPHHMYQPQYGGHGNSSNGGQYQDGPFQHLGAFQQHQQHQQRLLYGRDGPYQMYTKKKNELRDSVSVDGGDGDKLRFLRPERVRTESKNYTPIQFERSLGKLQVVSVNYPRKILDMGVQRLSEEEDRTVPPDRDLLWFRQLMLDIEKLYTLVLAHEDGGCPPERRAELSERLFAEVQPSEDRLLQLMSIRKGRALVLRILPILGRRHGVSTLATVLRHLSLLQRKDRLDGILRGGLRSVFLVASHASLSDLVQLAASLMMNPVPSLANPFAVRVTCSLIERAEQIFLEEGDSVSNEEQRKWTKLLSEMADHLWLLVTSPEGQVDEEALNSLPLLTRERHCLSSHLRRFALTPNLAEALSRSPQEQQHHQQQLQQQQQQQQHNGFGDIGVAALG